MKKSGFTLIEAVVTMAIVGVVMITAGTVLVNSLRTSTKTEISSKLESAATWTMGEIKRNILQSRSDLVNCVVGPSSSIGFTNPDDGEPTTIVCNQDAAIASESIHRANLTTDGIKVINCDNFVSCTDNGNRKVIDINFTLSTGDTSTVATGYIRSFNQKIVLRQ